MDSDISRKRRKESSSSRKSKRHHREHSRDSSHERHSHSREKHHRRREYSRERSRRHHERDDRRRRSRSRNRSRMRDERRKSRSRTRDSRDQVFEPQEPRISVVEYVKEESISEYVESKVMETQDLAVEAQDRLKEAEEKIRQRKERIEQWRKEKALKEASESFKEEENQPVPSNHNWSLENDDEDEEEAHIEVDVPDKEFMPPPLRPREHQDQSKNATQIKRSSTQFSFKKSTQFGAISIKSIAPVKSGEQSLFRKSNTIFQDREEDGEAKSVEKSKPSKHVTEIVQEDIQDPLDSFMKDIEVKLDETKKVSSVPCSVPMKFHEDEMAEPVDEKDLDEEDPAEAAVAAASAQIAAMKKKELAYVDHNEIEYEEFRKNFYIEPTELSEMTKEEVETKRLDLGGIKIRGSNCPKPIEKWTLLGLVPSVLETIRKTLKYDKPTPIQAQAIPAIMSGRDVIGIAKTGSGKTIAFLLPMVRHLKDQRPVLETEGPIAIIMTPTRELAVQIHKECRHFIKPLGLRSVCCYGGAPIKEQIAEVKRGTEILICTPGRLIDLLCANSGRVMNLKRVTYLVLDEADRMFDMGFEPQVMRVVTNIRPDRQTVLFSATFPKKMEALARKILVKPIEITVGGRSVVCGDVEQYVEVIEEDTKFLRLLEILGKTFEQDKDAKILVFVDRQEAADSLLGQLMKRGYPCATLHGGKDQADRDTTIADFKNAHLNILIATSIAARGLDVKQLKVVVNYECPNHLEDYVHRVGRTGRAGQKGTSYTFITRDQDKFATDIVKALKMSKANVPNDLMELVEQFNLKVRIGAAHYSSSGFGGKGLEKLDKDRDLVKRIQKKALGADLGDEEELDEEEKQEKLQELEANFEAKVIGSGDAVEQNNNMVVTKYSATSSRRFPPRNPANIPGLAKAKEIIDSFTNRISAPGFKGSAYCYEIEINDYPQRARWMVTSKEQINMISETTGAAVTTRGSYYPTGTFVPTGKRKLYLCVEGDSQLAVDKAKAEIKRIITEVTVSSKDSETLLEKGTTSRYSVL